MTCCSPPFVVYSGYAKKAEYDRAIADYTKAIALDVNFKSAYIARGHAYETKGDKSRAIDDFRAALEKDPHANDSRAALSRLGARP